MINNLTSEKPENGALASILRAAFLICVFSVFTFAQTATKKPVENITKTNHAPKITQIDETQIAELLKPHNKPLLVNFWATWCVPCREEFPELVELDKKFKGKVDIITISLDDLAEINRDVPKFLIEMRATMPAYLLHTDKESEVISSVSKDWQGGLPFTVIFNEKGEITHTKQGKINPEVVKAKINELLTQDTAQLYGLDFQFRQKNSRDYENRVQDAKKDIAEGKYIIKGFGFGAATLSESRQELKDEVFIEYQDYGCDITNEQIEYIEGYNKISKAAIKQKSYLY